MKSEKVTIYPETDTRRRYDDACGTAHGLELLGERWAMLVVRELLLGPRRFGDLKRDLPGISANVLTQRLEALAAAGIARRWQLPPPSRAQVYELTQWGYEAAPLIESLGRWAARSPGHDPSLPLSGTSLMLSFRTMFDARRAGAFAGRIGFRLGLWRFIVEVAEGQLTVERTEGGETDAEIAGDPRAVAAVVYGGVPLDTILTGGALTLAGDRDRVERFVRLFVLPPKAVSPPPRS